MTRIVKNPRPKARIEIEGMDGSVQHWLVEDASSLIEYRGDQPARGSIHVMGEVQQVAPPPVSSASVGDQELIRQLRAQSGELRTQVEELKKVLKDMTDALDTPEGCHRVTHAQNVLKDKERFRRERDEAAANCDAAARQLRALGYEVGRNGEDEFYIKPPLGKPTAFCFVQGLKVFVEGEKSSDQEKACKIRDAIRDMAKGPNYPQLSLRPGHAEGEVYLRVKPDASTAEVSILIQTGNWLDKVIREALELAMKGNEV